MPSGCGVGGDAFWLVWDATERRLVGLNGSGRAPGGADPAGLRARGLERLPRRGALSVTVPGAVRSWGDAHARWGRLSRDEVLADAIELAGGGFAAWPGFVTSVEATAPLVDAAVGPAQRLPTRLPPPARPAVAGRRARPPAGTRPHPRAPGERRVRRLLRRRPGGAPGAGSRRRRRAVRGGRLPGPPQHLDRAAHRVLPWRPRRHPPAQQRRRGRAPDPRPAGAVRPAGAERFGPAGWGDPGWIHLGIEASKLALVERDREIGDPEAAPVDVDGMLDPGHLDDLAASIDPTRARTDLPPVRTLVAGTIYLAAVDAEGGAVSLIQSNAAGFGSGVVDPDTGIHYQSRGASFSLVPGHRNELAPGRRTLHSLLPAMTFRAGAEDAGPWVVHGSMGGDVQPQVLAQVVSAIVDGRADVATAVGAPRWGVAAAGDDAPPLAVSAEVRLAADVLAALAARGHALERRPPFDAALGHCHAIELIDGGPAAGGTLAAATDPRSEGLPAAR